MSLNLQAKDSFYVFDEYGMLTVKSDELSWRDSIGMTVCAWIAYDMPSELEDSIEECLQWNREKKQWKIIRHPAHKEMSSRDHWSYFLIYRRLLCDWIPDNPWFNKLIKGVPFMRGLYLWMHSLTGNKCAERAYYTLYIPGAIIGNVWLRICRWAGRIKPELNNNEWIFVETDTPDEYENTGLRLQRNRTKWQRIWAEVIFQTIPAYPLHNKAWQLYVMLDSKRKERLKRILLKRVGKSNIMLRLLFEPKVIYNTDYLKGSYKFYLKGSYELVTQQEVDNYPHMTGYRPGVYLDETCRRTIRELTQIESEFNTYEKSLIQWLWNYEHGKK